MPTFWKQFTGKERDAETGLDYFLARYYSGAQGRFLSPDEWSGGPDDVLTGKDITPPGPLPYADIRNPQSLNKYAYVYNNPLRYTDPDGHIAAINTGASAI
jgi:RHS repeat-associated protein